MILGFNKQSGNTQLAYQNTENSNTGHIVTVIYLVKGPLLKYLQLNLDSKYLIQVEVQFLNNQMKRKIIHTSFISKNIRIKKCHW